MRRRDRANTMSCNNTYACIEICDLHMYTWKYMTSRSSKCNIISAGLREGSVQHRAEGIADVDASISWAECMFICVCVRACVRVCVCVCVCVMDAYIHMYTYKNTTLRKRQADGTATMGWLGLVGSLKLQVSFAEYSLFYIALLQKRPIILRSLLIGATPYYNSQHAK